MIDLEKKLEDGERRERDAEERYRTLQNEMAQLQEKLKVEKELREKEGVEAHKRAEEMKKEYTKSEDLDQLRTKLQATEEKVKESAIRLFEQQKQSEEERQRHEKERNEREQELQSQLEAEKESGRLLLEKGQKDNQERKLEREKDQKEKDDLHQEIMILKKTIDDWKSKNQKVNNEFEVIKGGLEKSKLTHFLLLSQLMIDIEITLNSSSILAAVGDTSSLFLCFSSFFLHPLCWNELQSSCATLSNLLNSSQLIFIFNLLVHKHPTFRNWVIFLFFKRPIYNKHMSFKLICELHLPDIESFFVK
eukprot:TRINITY_DN1968_c0_g1_i3.p1 TRINITY_DN1968_c0_g1~~TRINITY_DN1968_c0_g1_i3.p1  ORF type:complete len:306 (+),score=91.52 TRINITY_DN1968_c0_g1_i3:927-1844(+)